MVVLSGDLPREGHHFEVLRASFFADEAGGRLFIVMVLFFGLRLEVPIFWNTFI